MSARDEGRPLTAVRWDEGRNTNKMHIALLSPEIPPNTGNIARLCAATCSTLHLIRPLGFFLDDKHLKRAGLDYWEHVELHIHDALADFFRVIDPTRCYFFSTSGVQSYTDVTYRPEDCLMFGAETSGLPKSLLTQSAARVLKIPMSGPVRSLNLATAVAIPLFEFLRQQRLVR